MRTLIFGAKGQLGRDLLRVFHAQGEVQGFDLPEADIADEVAVQPIIERFAPDLIVNAAACWACCWTFWAICWPAFF